MRTDRDEDTHFRKYNIFKWIAHRFDSSLPGRTFGFSFCCVHVPRTSTTLSTVSAVKAFLDGELFYSFVRRKPAVCGGENVKWQRIPRHGGGRTRFYGKFDGFPAKQCWHLQTCPETRATVNETKLDGVFFVFFPLESTGGSGCYRRDPTSLHLDVECNNTRTFVCMYISIRTMTFWKRSAHLCVLL